VKLTGTRAEAGATSAGDPYLPEAGNGGYRVSRYDLDLTYRMSSNRLAGRAIVSAVATQPLTRFSLDLAGLSANKVSINGRRAAKFACRGGKLHVWPAEPVPVGASLTIDVHYSGNPRPVKGRWGAVGWEELTEGVIVASQPNGAPSWFPCNDHPADKASFRISVTTDSPYRVVSNGTLVDREVRAGQTTWVFDQPEPMATYLASVQIGAYELLEISKSPVRLTAAVPVGLRSRFGNDFGRQAQMMSAFSRLFGRYPYRQYTVVVTDDPLEIPIEAQGMSVFGVNHLDGERGHERLVAHELAHQWFGNSVTVSSWQHIWLNEGFACYAEWLWSEESGGPSADYWAERAWRRLDGLPQNLIVADPGPDLMFDDRLYKRGALTLHALRTAIGDDAFFDLLRSWTDVKRHATASTDEFVAHAERFSEHSLRGLFNAWLFEPKLPAL
jgi:aminopeptidase